MDELLIQLQRDFPTLSFRAAKEFCWSPGTQEVLYPAKASNNSACWSLLHETAHALLEHNTYDNDFSLIALEADAWQKAVQLGKTYGILIDSDHIEDCLDTYRDWLHSRSLCPNCHSNGIERASGNYTCLNCHSTWHVAKEKLHRVYRRKQKTSPTGLV